eukprot:1159888-Pelagomonas_calceolata.AAC.6
MRGFVRGCYALSCVKWLRGIQKYVMNVSSVQRGRGRCEPCKELGKNVSCAKSWGRTCDGRELCKEVRTQEVDEKCKIWARCAFAWSAKGAPR